MPQHPVRKFAFIDAQNTETTTRRMLGFIIDWKKLYTFLKHEWRCDTVFFYSGIDAGDSETEKEFEENQKRYGVKKGKGREARPFLMTLSF